MASTFSTRLKIELIGDGEQAGSWGTTTNNNFNQSIEQAIAGAEKTGFQCSIFKEGDIEFKVLKWVCPVKR